LSPIVTVGLPVPGRSVLEVELVVVGSALVVVVVLAVVDDVLERLSWW
jgi:hypothetical protein